MNILMVMDSSSSADLIGLSLRNGGIVFEWTRVYDEQSMRAAIASVAPDVILCEDVLLKFDCLSALAVNHELCPESPLIVISGGKDEELAIECIKVGAHDFVLLSNLARLPRAVERAVREAGERARDEQEKREQEARDRYLARMVEQAGYCVISTDLEGVVRSWNRAAEMLYEFSSQEAIGKSLRLLHLSHIPDEEYRTILLSIRSGNSYWAQYVPRSRSGKKRRVVATHEPLIDDRGALIGQIVVTRNVSEYARNQAPHAHLSNA